MYILFKKKTVSVVARFRPSDPDLVVWKSLTLAITFEPEEVEHAFVTCIRCDKTLHTVP